ncbi:YdcF family protein [Leclercia sp. 29361]|uniref:YdcF family protein n=1 Tax=Leclercia TaxID=83654 RepID=UPI00140E03CF|nr:MULTISPECIES: YdcF family protein [Leclercia]MCU6684652.1 YdcF family protein [Leclercia tamurae]QIK14095.1 YdcF family protein [Leclercia sp. 29361]
MSLTIFPSLPDKTLAAVNTVGAWLAEDNLPFNPPALQPDLVVLAGNAVIPSIDAACRLASELAIPLLISGGIGHSTTFLYAAIARHPRYNRVRTTGKAEATILAEIAREFWHIPPERLLVEDQSTNCGENARFSAATITHHHLTVKRGIVVQDPTMQRRTMATFARVWRDKPDAPAWTSHPGIVPQLQNSEDGLVFRGGGEGLWPVERYLSLVLGELPRLRDDINGYGPLGRDFIVHVDIPAEVETAWQILRNDVILTEALVSRSLL